MRLAIGAVLAAVLTTAQDLPGNRPGIQAGQVIDLSLDDALQATLRDNLELQVSRLDLEIANRQLAGARALFDPAWTFDTGYSKRATPISSVLGGAASGRLDETSLSATPGLAGLLRTGASYTVGSGLEKQTSSSVFAPLNPQFVSNLRIAFTQPLLRGRRIDGARRTLTVAGRNREWTAEQLRQRVINAAARTARAYFTLLASQEAVTVQRDAHEVARQALATNQRLAAQGLIPEVDLLTARAQVAALEAAYFRALDGVTAAENALKLEMLGSSQAPWWSAQFRLTTAPEADPARFTAVEIPLDEAVKQALRDRPEAAQAATSVAISGIEERYAREQIRPQLDLTSSYTASGLAGATANRVSPFGPSLSAVPPQLIGGAGDSLQSAYAQRFPSVQAGLRFSLPVGNRAAEASLAAARLAQNQAKLRAAQVEQGLAAEVRNAAQALWSAKARLRAAVAEREFAQSDFESQQRKIQSGLTSSFELFTKHTRLVDAQGGELQARADVRNALVELERSMGRTLKVYGITVQPAPR